MRAKKPVWTLKAPCPQCEQGSSLVLVRCPECQHLVAACDEEGSCFADPKTLRIRLEAPGLDGDFYRGAWCPSCSKVRVADFDDATGEQILQSGLTPKEYE